MNRSRKLAKRNKDMRQPLSVQVPGFKKTVDQAYNQLAAAFKKKWEDDETLNDGDIESFDEDQDYID